MSNLTKKDGAGTAVMNGELANPTTTNTWPSREGVFAFVAALIVLLPFLVAGCLRRNLAIVNRTGEK
jgi:hypothetical protein